MIRHIVIFDSDRGIAKNGDMPWHLSNELAYFKKTTQSHGGVVLVGRKTYQTIGRALQGRRLVVATRNPGHNLGDVETVGDIAAFLRREPDVWIAGGAELYEETLTLADELYATELSSNFNCDQFYPEFSRLFTLQRATEYFEENALSYRHCRYVRA